MIINIFVLLPTFVLLIISGILILTAISIIKIFKSVGEPIFIHVAIIFVFLFLTFITGSIGVLLSLDQTSDPLFLFNVFAISMTYVGVGFVYRNLSQGISIISEYLLLLSLLAPFYAISLMLGLNFSIIPAILSQLIPLIIVLIIDHSILLRIRIASVQLNQDNDVKALKMLEDIFFLSRIIHFLGILAMISFSLLALFSLDFQVEVIWGPKWQLFDYLYFIALILLMIMFLKIFLRLREMTDNVLNADIPTIINSLLD